MTTIKRFLIWVLAPVMKLWTWHVLRKCRCICGNVGFRKDMEPMLGRCGDCYFKVLMEARPSSSKRSKS